LFKKLVRVATARALWETQAAPSLRGVLLWKSDHTTVDLVPDYFGFRIPNEFVVGYGLHYNDEFRHYSAGRKRPSVIRRLLFLVGSLLLPALSRSIFGTRFGLFGAPCIPE